MARVEHAGTLSSTAVVFKNPPDCGSTMVFRPFLLQSKASVEIIDMSGGEILTAMLESAYMNIPHVFGGMISSRNQAAQNV